MKENSLQHNLISRHVIKLLNVMVACVICIMVMSGKGHAGTVDITVTGTYDYDRAYEFLEILNEARVEKGLKKLTMDADLLDAAMLRSAEITIYFQHIRPDGTNCFTASDKMFGENIAMGNSTAINTYYQWYNSSGHYANMFDANYTTIGVGVCGNYWVTCFGYGSADTVSKTGTKNFSAVIPVLDSYLEIYAYDVTPDGYNSDGTGWYYVGSTGYFMYGIANYNPELPTYAEGVYSDYKFSSSNSSVLKIDSKGNITALSPGTVTITISLKGNSSIKYTEKITVKANPSATPTPTKKPTVAPTKTPTPTPTKKVTATPTPTKKVTATPTPTKKVTVTPIPTKGPVVQITDTPTKIPTAVPTISGDKVTVTPTPEITGVDTEVTVTPGEDEDAVQNPDDGVSGGDSDSETATGDDATPDKNQTTDKNESGKNELSTDETNKEESVNADADKGTEESGGFFEKNAWAIPAIIGGACLGIIMMIVAFFKKKKKGASSEK